VLHDLSGPLGTVAWKSLRSCLLWSLATDEDRPSLFDSGALRRRRAELREVLGTGGHPLAGPLEAMARVLGPADRVDPEELAAAASEVADWASAAGLPRTALEFRQAAALFLPDDPELALSVLRTARDHGSHSRAEAWFHRTVGLARRVRAWDTYVEAYVDHATMMGERGALPAARRSWMKAYRRANRQGFAPARARALQELFVLETYAGRRREADRFAREAALAMAPSNPALPLLGHDVAMAWLARGRFSAALRLLESLERRVSRGLRAAVIGARAWAAGGLGEDAGFEDARAELERLPPGPELTDAWAGVARGALLLGRRSDARNALLRSGELSRAGSRDPESHGRFGGAPSLEALEAELAAGAAGTAARGGKGDESAARAATDRLVDLLDRGPLPDDRPSPS
jgi:tetratricopeptide (TPR) repeat protein